MHAWHLSGYTHTQLDACVRTVPVHTHAHAYTRTYEYMNRYIIGIPISLHIDIYTCLPRHARPHRAIDTRTCVYTYPYAHARGDGLQTNAGGAADACVCASRHPYMPGCTPTMYRWVHHTRARAHAHAQAHMRALRWSLRAYTHMHSYIHTYADVCT